MKLTAASIAALAASGALAASVCSGPLPASAFADTESTTNIPFSVCLEGGRLFDIRMEFLATPSNNVEVAFGRDDDMDGSLQPCEIGLAVGWDCGEWTVRGPGLNAEMRLPASSAAARKRFSWTLRGYDGAALALACSENGHPLDLGLAGPPPGWMLDQSWDTVRFAVRGVDASGESFRAGISANGTWVSFR